MFAQQKCEIPKASWALQVAPTKDSWVSQISQAHLREFHGAQIQCEMFLCPPIHFSQFLFLIDSIPFTGAWSTLGKDKRVAWI